MKHEDKDSPDDRTTAADERFDVEYNSRCDVQHHWDSTSIQGSLGVPIPYNVPIEDTWKPLRFVQHLSEFETFVKSQTFQDFVKPPDFQRFRNR